MKHTLFGKAILLFLGLTLSTTVLSAKDKTVTVSPETAEIYVNGSLVGHGSYVLHYTAKDDFHVVKVHEAGYIDKEIKVWKKNKVDNVFIKLEEDDCWAATATSEYANKRFTIVVRPDLDAKTAWKVITQTLLNYFPEMQITDYSAGYMTTPSAIKNFPKAELKVANKVQVKELTNDGQLTYQVIIISEKAGLYGNSSYQKYDRILREFESLINELQTRLGAKNI